MRRNALARIEGNAVMVGVRRATAVAGRCFRPRRVVPDAAFQDADDPAPGHWRRFPEPWLGGTGEDEAHTRALHAALEELPETWRRIVLRHDGTPADPAPTDAAPADIDVVLARDLGLTVEQERDILARARAALRDRLDDAARRA